MYQVMDRTYKPPAGVDQCTINFLKTLKQSDAVNALPEIGLTVTPEENAKGWQKMKEKTGSESDTPDFNHYMCGCKDETINIVDAFLRSSPFEIGTLVDMWQRIVDLMVL